MIAPLHRQHVARRPTLLAAVLLGVWMTAAQAAPIVTTFYDQSNGNMTLAVLEGGSSATLAVSGFQFLSPSQYLSGAAAAIPPAAFPAFTVLNTASSSIYEPPRQYAEIYANGFGSTLFSSTWNLGNVAQIGLTHANVNAGFQSNGDVLPPALPGKFLYESGGTWIAGDIVVVPEPASAAVLGSVAAFGATFLATLRRRSRVRSHSCPPGRQN